MASAAVRVSTGELVRSLPDPGVLDTILDPDVALAIWTRRPPIAIDTLDGFADLRFTCAVAAVETTLADLLAAQPCCSWHTGFAIDAAGLARLYAAIMAVDRVEIRLERVHGKGCWRFHADYVTVRLITTCLGQGTEWCARDGGGDSAIRRLAAGDVGLFKGRLLAPDAPIVHRSPPIDGLAEERLLLVIDPVFAEAAQG